MNLFSNVFHALLLLSFLTFFSCKPNEAPDKKLRQQIDNLFQQWDRDDSPGAAVAILKEGEVIFKKGYGMANLEYSIPITPSTIFHIASESKQFTDFCIVLLAQRGMLSLDDDIRKHLPYVPDFGKKITIRHLIHHTSGLRDQWQLMALSGTRLDDVITQDHVIKLVKSQKRLNFDPGERFLYCNTGYTLLAEIVEKVSGQSLRAFAEKEIFEPLGMEDTHFHDDYQEVVPHRAYSYYPTEDRTFKHSVLSYATVGATSLFTTVEDEAKWLHNFTTAQVGSQEAIDQMFQRGVLNAGDTLSYAFGLGMEEHKGWKMIGHGGSDAGYRTFVVRFPEAGLGIVVFSNLSDFNPRGMALNIADLMLEDRSEKKDAETVNIEKDAATYYTGNFLNTAGSPVSIIDSTKLYIKTTWDVAEMTPLSDTSFSAFGGWLTIRFRKGDEDYLELMTSDEKRIFHRYEPYTVTQGVFAAYEGVYYNEETEASYKIYAENEQLMLGHIKYEAVPLRAYTKDQFAVPHWWMENIIFDRNAQEEITGFEVNSGRVQHLYFRKIN